MDDVIFACKPRLLDVGAQLKRSAHESLGLAINCAQLQANGRTGLLFGRLKKTSHVATPGAESAVYDCLVCYSFELQSKTDRTARTVICCNYSYFI